MRHLPPRIRRLLEQDPRYRWEAYQFLQESLVYAQQVLRLGRRRPTQAVDSASDSDEAHDQAHDQAHVEPHDLPIDEAPDSDDSSHLEPHLTGQELCEVLRRRAIEQYGYLAKSVLNSWGVNSTSDFGEIVYNLIGIECLKKSKTDRREDFDDVYDFDTAFRQEFRIEAASLDAESDDE